MAKSKKRQKGGKAVLQQARATHQVPPAECRRQRMHAVLGTPLQSPFPESVQTADFALGCFWGAERIFLM